MTDVNGWLDMGHGLDRKTHYFRNGVAVCSSRITWGENRLQPGTDLPGPNSCHKCLLSDWMEQEAGRTETSHPER